MAAATTEQLQLAFSAVPQAQIVMGKDCDDHKKSDMLDADITSKLSARPATAAYSGQISDTPVESHWRTALHSGESLVTVRDIKSAFPK